MHHANTSFSRVIVPLRTVNLRLRYGRRLDRASFVIAGNSAFYFYVLRASLPALLTIHEPAYGDSFFENDFLQTRLE
jgi:hypothetical protein